MCTTVVDARQQHRLVADGDAGAAELIDGARDLGGDLAGVVEMDVHP